MGPQRASGIALGMGLCWADIPMRMKMDEVTLKTHVEVSRCDVEIC